MKRYLLVKVFVWFWVTIIATILLLLGISMLQPDVVETHRISKPMLQNLRHLELAITEAGKHPDFTLNDVAKLRKRKARNIYLSHRDPERSFAANPRITALNLDLLSFTEDTKPLAIFTPEYKAFGPLEVTLDNERYRLYLIFQNHTPSALIKLRTLPLWIKIAVVLGASLLLCFWFTRDLLTPIKALQKTAARLSKGELASRAEINEKRQDELGQLGHDFNLMADRLESLVNNQKRLLADISHELRSPLTRLQMATGLAAGYATKESQSYIERIEREAQLVENMLSDILHLSKLEADQVPIEKQSIQLSELLDPIIEDAHFEAEQLGKRLTASPLPDVTLYGDPMLLNRAFENIIRNAIKYAKCNISVDVSQSDEQLVCTINDDGKGVSADMLDKLCIPFFRVSSARTPEQNQKGGFGLGLAIAQHALKVHDAHIEFSNNVGLEVSIRIPLLNR
ncbi:ATP-binding protein [Pseudoalteromonas piscicida]|uniref:histidine kinase n=1 Tax=Pseudoalteromonas piscicida TaxID=43662 RepID=A0A2A5JRN6_PSEO7|nr:ATP-binding protein [Pseudoalteromonas piscicida]PCK32113.1 two-component sensor histidine kinase [Pseudoalteromonas piscicida]